MTHKATFGFVLEYVSDVQRAKGFFTDVLGLQVERDHPTFVQFKTSGGAYALASDERMEPGRGDPELWWVVDDARSAFAEMSARADVAMPLREMPFGTCFGIKDPAGQVHYMIQLSANRPSQPV
jgi:catechol 2,3-dioxygenase-like lactoylglutathione lyase family enzyme